jgi:hypothetical protein
LSILDPGRTPRIIFPRAWKSFFGVKIFDADPGSGKENIRIRDQHPGSSTLFVTSVVDWYRFDAVPDPDPTFHFKADPDPD